MGYRIVQRAVRIDDGTTRVDSVLSPAWSQATSGGAYTTYLSNLIVTGTTPSYQLSDPKGTIVGTVTQAGAFSATPIPDEYGNIATVPASRLDWLGTQKRFVDHPGLDIVRMGVRAYDPHIGRFLSQDPIAGGSANDYDYVNGDPINNLDLGGTRCWTGRNASGSCRSIARGYRRLVRSQAVAATNIAGREWGLAATLAGGKARKCGRGSHCVTGSWLVVPWADAGTLGNTIVCHRGCDRDLITHEKVHVSQFQQGGIAYVALYAWESAFGGIGCSNKYEQPAYATNGSC